jgi:thiol-disulfide isomerase/thioredoxin
MKRLLCAVLLMAWSFAGAASTEVNLYRVATTPFKQPGGGSLQLETLQGRPAVINFWATWCPPCREELPLLVKTHARYEKKYPKKIAFIGLAVEDNVEFVSEYAGAYGLRYPIAVGREAAIALMQAIGNEQAGMPYTVVVNAEGQVVYAKRGAVTEKELTKALAPLLKP